MIKLLEVILQSFWTWCGTFIFLLVIAECITNCVKMICYTICKKDMVVKRQELEEKAEEEEQ